MSNPNNRGTIGKGGIIGIVVGCVVVMALLVVILYLVTVNKKSNAEEVKGEIRKRGTVVTEDNINEVMEVAEEEYSQLGSYEVTMNSNWHFVDGKTPSDNAYVENSTANSNDVYFDVTLEDTGENIYSSPVIPVGNYLDDITLEKDLDAGTYDCILTYTLVDKDQNPLSNVSVSVTVTVDE